MTDDKVNILLVDDQPAKLLTYRAILEDIGENLLSASNATEALELLLKNDVAVVLIDVYMPDIDGFQLAAMIRNHPRFEKTALIFISAILLTDVDRLRGYEMGAVDYVPVPVIPEVLRAKVKVFVELFRKTRQLEQLNRELEARVAERTSALAASTLQLRQSERLRSLALAAGQMGSWEWNVARKTTVCDQGQCDIFGVDPSTFVPTRIMCARSSTPKILSCWCGLSARSPKHANTFQTEFRVRRPNGEVRWCTGTAAASFDESGRLIWVSGVTADITERKRAEERQILLAEEVDHRARNVVAVVQSIMRLTRADSIDDYMSALDGRIGALSNAHRLLAGSRWEGADLTRLVEEEFAPYLAGGTERVSARGPVVLLPPATAQTIALALHELATNAANTAPFRPTYRPCRSHVEQRLRETRIDLDRVERTRHQRAQPPRLWQPRHHRRYRAPARRHRGVRLAGKRAALQIMRTPRRQEEFGEATGVQATPTRRRAGPGHHGRPG